MSAITEDELLAVLDAVESGRVDVVAVGRSWHDVFAGEVTFRTSDGWTLVVFNDCDAWDYLDSATAPDGRTFDHDDHYALDAEGRAEEIVMPRLLNWGCIGSGCTFERWTQAAVAGTE